MNKYRHLFSADEWEHFLKLGAALHDPKEKKEFFEAVVEGKQRDRNYEITGYVPKKKVGERVCKEVLEMLRHGKRKDEAV